MNDLTLLLIGGALTILGGVANDEVHALRERRRELKSIKSAIADELSEIESTIKNMHEVWEKTKVLHSSYLSDLLSDTTAFDSLRLRLFLIGDATLRKDVVIFYKKIRDTIKKYEGKVGSLADTPEVIAEQGAIEGAFTSLGNDAKNIRGRLE